MKRLPLLIVGLVLVVASLVATTRAQAGASITYRPVVCHYGAHACHQWRVVQPQGKSLVRVHERRRAPLPFGPWSSWKAISVD